MDMIKLSIYVYDDLYIVRLGWVVGRLDCGLVCLSWVVRRESINLAKEGRNIEGGGFVETRLFATPLFASCVQYLQYSQCFDRACYGVQITSRNI